MTWEADDRTRCSARLVGRLPHVTKDGQVTLGEHGGLQCSLEYDHENGHVYVNGTWVPDRHGEAS